MGGGDDGGYTERQDRIDADKAKARSALNVLFGIAPQAATVDRAKFTTQPTYNLDGDTLTTGGFDQAGYDAAAGAGAGQAAEAAKNKTALDALFAQTRADAYTAGKRRVDEQKQTAGRNLKFELFARGLNGGSADVDQNALLGREYAQGLIDVGAKADTTANGLKSANEAARLQLLQSIDAGMDQSSATSAALGQMRTAADQAAADAIGTNLGDLFTNQALIYNQNRVALGRQNANNWWQTNQGTRSGGGSSGSRAGVLSFAG